MAAFSGSGIALASDARIEAQVPRPARNVFCVGKNYHEHAKEFARSGFDSSASSAADAIPTAPIIFTKAPECVVADGDDILYPTGVSDSLDYEAELAVVIGRGGRGIAKARAYDHVCGYTIVNDVTARDLQARHKQWFLGKSLDSFCPMGPVAGDGRRGRPGEPHGQMLGERRAAPGCQYARPDLRHPDPDRDDVGRHDLAAGRRDRDRHASRRQTSASRRRSSCIPATG